MNPQFRHFLETSCFSTYNGSECDAITDHSLSSDEKKKNLMRKLSFRENFGDIATDCTDASSDVYSDVFTHPRRKMTNELNPSDQFMTQPFQIFDSEELDQDSDMALEIQNQPQKMMIMTPPDRTFEMDLFPHPLKPLIIQDNDEKMEEEDSQPQDHLFSLGVKREPSLLERLNAFDQNLCVKNKSEKTKKGLRLNVGLGENFRVTDSPNSCMIRSVSEKSEWSFESPRQRYNNSSLGTVKNFRTPDLRTITPETLIELIENPQGKKFLVIDCRYPYEYQGGHVKGAINITSPEDLEELLIRNRHLVCREESLEQIKRDWKGTLMKARLRPHEETTVNDIPPILIFHCEFSQKRGPRALRRLRTLDRNHNYANWPNLFYPEVYVLENGYKNFHTKFPTHCNPVNQYIRMVDKQYKPMYVEAKAHERKVWKKREPSVEDSPPAIVPLQRFKTMSCL